MNTEVKNKREPIFDTLRFIGIFLVVFGHIIESYDFKWADIVYKCIYLFHMPLLIFISGYFSKFY